MDLNSDTDFLALLKTKGIGYDPEYPDAWQLTFLESPDLWRRWSPPPVPSDLLGFMSSLLDSVAPRERLWLWRRGGGKWYDGDYGPLSDQIRDRIVRAAGVPEDFAGAVGFPEAESRAIYTLALAFYVLAWSVGEDLYLVPDHGRCFLMTSHHGQVYGHFQDQAALESFTAEMAKRGHDVE